MSNLLPIYLISNLNMNANVEKNRARKAALLAKKDSDNILKYGVNILEQYRSGWSIVEIAVLSSETEDPIRISAIRNFVNNVNSIVSLIKSHVEGVSAKEIARKLNIEIDIVLEELKWFQHSKIIIQKGQVWIHKKYE